MKEKSVVYRTNGFGGYRWFCGKCGPSNDYHPCSHLVPEREQNAEEEPNMPEREQAEKSNTLREKARAVFAEHMVCVRVTAGDWHLKGSSSPDEMIADIAQAMAVERDRVLRLLGHHPDEECCEECDKVKKCQ